MAHDNYAHMQIRLLTPQEWWAQGWDRPSHAMYCIVNTSDKYQHRHYCPVPAPRIVCDPCDSYEAVSALLDQWRFDWAWDDMYTMDQ